MFVGLFDISKQQWSSVAVSRKPDPFTADGIRESFGLRRDSSSSVLCRCQLWQYTTKYCGLLCWCTVLNFRCNNVSDVYVDMDLWCKFCCYSAHLVIYIFVTTVVLPSLFFYLFLCIVLLLVVVHHSQLVISLLPFCGTKWPCMWWYTITNLLT